MHIYIYLPGHYRSILFLAGIYGSFERFTKIMDWKIGRVSPPIASYVKMGYANVHHDSWWYRVGIIHDGKSMVKQTTFWGTLFSNKTSYVCVDLSTQEDTRRNKEKQGNNFIFNVHLWQNCRSFLITSTCNVRVVGFKYPCMPVRFKKYHHCPKGIEE